MQLGTLEKTPLSEVTKAFNEGFSDYIVKIDVTEEYLTDRLRGARVSLEHSVGGWVENQLVALLINGIDTRNGTRMAFNAGTCVAPRYRGNRFTELAYQFLIPRLRGSGVNRCGLEVIQSNERAIHVYEKMGFARTRELLCYSGSGLQPRANNAPESHDLKLTREKSVDLNAARSMLDFPLSWENELTEVMNAAGHECYCMWDGNRLVGFAIVKSNGQLLSIAVSTRYRRRGIATRLFHEVLADHSDIRIGNIDRRCLASQRFLESMGLHNDIDQFEMEMPI